MTPKTATKRLNAILETLRTLHGVRLDLKGSDIGDVEAAFREAVERRDHIIRESRFNEYHSNPEYTKTVLILEAMRLFLREIAPKRLRRRRVAETRRADHRQDGRRLDAELIQAVEAELKNLDRSTVAEGANTMSGKTLIKEARNVKDTLSRQVAALREKVDTVRQDNRAKVAEKRKLQSRFATLLEAELEQAEVILAAKSMGDDLQKMAENLASMQVQDLMPLVDRMKEEFDGGKADAFNKAVLQVLQAALDSIKLAKEGIENEVLRLQGENPGNDMAAFGDPNAPAADPAADPLAANDMAATEPSSTPAAAATGSLAAAAADDVMRNGRIDYPVRTADPFGGADAAMGPEEEPLGRARKESRRPKGRMVKEYGVTRGGMIPQDRTAHLTLVDDLHSEGFDHTAANWIADIMTHDGLNKAQAVEKYFAERHGGRAAPGCVAESRRPAAKPVGVKKKFDEAVDHRAVRRIDLDLPPEVNTALDDFEFYIGSRGLPIREARKRVLAKHRRLAEAANRSGSLMVSAQAVAQALDRHLAENHKRLSRISRLNGLTMPEPLAQAVRRTGLSETQFRDALTGYLADARGKLAEGRYAKVVGKLAETSERNPAGIAQWVAGMVERQTLGEVARFDTYQSFTRKLLDEARGRSLKPEDLLGRLKGPEQDVALIANLHEAVIANGMAAAYRTGAFKPYRTVTERLRRVKGDAARHVEGILGRATQVIDEHKTEHADLDAYGIDLLGQLDERYRGVQPDFELALSEHLKGEPDESSDN